MSVTPNMNLTLPTPTVTDGPDWAEQINTALEAVDDHDHSSGKGQRVTPAGMDINDDLDVDSNNLLNVNTVELVNQDTALSGVSNICRLQFVDGDFYIVNSGGVAVQITDGDAIISTVVVPSSPLMPAGTVLDFAGGTVPVGFLACNGAAVSRTTYADLFNAIGTTWGVGDGSTTFNLPDTQCKTSIGSGTYLDPVAGSTTRSVGQGQNVENAIGAATHILTEAQMPSHRHTQTAHTHTTVGPSAFLLAEGVYGGQNASGSTTSGSTLPPDLGLTGGGTSHNNMQPSIVFTKMIKT